MIQGQSRQELALLTVLRLVVTSGECVVLGGQLDWLCKACFPPRDTPPLHLALDRKRAWCPGSNVEAGWGFVCGGVEVGGVGCLLRSQELPESCAICG